MVPPSSPSGDLGRKRSAYPRHSSPVLHRLFLEVRAPVEKKARKGEAGAGKGARAKVLTRRASLGSRQAKKGPGQRALREDDRAKRQRLVRLQAVLRKEGATHSGRAQENSGHFAFGKWEDKGAALTGRPGGLQHQVGHPQGPRSSLPLPPEMRRDAEAPRESRLSLLPT